MKDLYEEAMQQAAGTSTTPEFTKALARQADFTDYCRVALEVCTDYYRSSLPEEGDGPVSLTMELGKHFQVSQGLL